MAPLFSFEARIIFFLFKFFISSSKCNALTGVGNSFISLAISWLKLLRILECVSGTDIPVSYHFPTLFSFIICSNSTS